MWRPRSERRFPSRSSSTAQRLNNDFFEPKIGQGVNSSWPTNFSIGVGWGSCLGLILIIIIAKGWRVMVKVGATYQKKLFWSQAQRLCLSSKDSMSWLFSQSNPSLPSTVKVLLDVKSSFPPFHAHPLIESTQWKLYESIFIHFVFSK